MEYIFEARAHREEPLLEELARMLEKRTDVRSREQLPRLWAVTDRLNEKFGSPRPRKRWYSILLIVLGLLVSVPGLLEPVKLALPLAVGLAAVLYGIVRLFPSHRPGKKQFRLAAEQLLQQFGNLQDRQFRLIFSADGMKITNLVTGTTLAVPYENFECVVESEHLFLLIYNRQVTVLAKEDLVQGDPAGLSTLLQPRLRLL